MRNNHKLQLKKLGDVAEVNKFWKDLVLGFHTHASTKSGHVYPTPTYGSATLPTTLQDLCVVAGKKMAKEYGLEDFLSRLQLTMKALQRLWCQMKMLQFRS